MGTKVKTYTYVTGDLTDKTSWFADAGTKTAQALSDSGDGLTFTSPDINWVDKSKVTMRGDLGTTLDIKVYSNASEVTSGFTINHAAGSVTFDSSESGNTITADYRYAQTSNHVMTPSSGLYYRLSTVTAQFDAGASFSNGFEFKAWLNNAATGNQDYCVGTVAYCHARDLVARCSKMEMVKGFGGVTDDIIKLTWDFAKLFEPTVKDYAYKVFPVGTGVNPEMREFNKLSLQMVNDEVVTGSSFCTATFNLEEDSF